MAEKPKVPDPVAPRSTSLLRAIGKSVSSSFSEGLAAGAGSGGSSDFASEMVRSYLSRNNERDLDDAVRRVRSQTTGDLPRLRSVQADGNRHPELKIRKITVNDVAISTGNRKIDDEVKRVLSVVGGVVNEFQENTAKAYKSLDKRTTSVEGSVKNLYSAVDKLKSANKVLADQMGRLIAENDGERRRSKGTLKPNDFKSTNVRNRQRDERGRFLPGPAPQEKSTSVLDIIEDYLALKTGKNILRSGKNLLRSAGRGAGRLVMRNPGTAMVAGIGAAAVGSNLLLDHYGIANKKAASVDERKARARRRWKEYNGTEPPPTTEKAEEAINPDAPKEQPLSSSDTEKKEDITLKTTGKIELEANDTIKLTAKNEIRLKADRIVLDGEVKFEKGPPKGVDALDKSKPTDASSTPKPSNNPGLVDPRNPLNPDDVSPLGIAPGSTVTSPGGAIPGIPPTVLRPDGSPPSGGDLGGAPPSPGSDGAVRRRGSSRRFADRPGETDNTPVPEAPNLGSATNERLAKARERFFAELDKDPQLRRDVIKTASMENGKSGKSMTSVIESMVNRAAMHGYKSLRQQIHDGFYGPVTRDHRLGEALSEKHRKFGEEAIKNVRLGSNNIGYRTDQGMLSDPGAREYMLQPDKSGWQVHEGENFFYMGAEGKKWARRQMELDKEYEKNGGTVPSRKDEVAPSLAPQLHPGPHDAGTVPLRVKGGVGGQAYGGGETNPGILSAAERIQASLGGELRHFSAFNDHYHQGTRSRHARGLAGDFSVKSGMGGSYGAAKHVRNLFTGAGLKEGTDFRIINEYATPSSSRATAGHIHYEFLSKKAAAKFQAWHEQNPLPGTPTDVSASRKEAPVPQPEQAPDSGSSAMAKELGIDDIGKEAPETKEQAQAREKMASELGIDDVGKGRTSTLAPGFSPEPTKDAPGFGSDDKVVAKDVEPPSLPDYDAAGNPTGTQSPALIPDVREKIPVPENLSPGANSPGEAAHQGDFVKASIQRGNTDPGFDKPKAERIGENPVHIRRPTNDAEAEAPTPGSDGYGSKKENPDGCVLCAP